MSIESSIDRLAAAIEKLASAVAAPVVVAQPEPVYTGESERAKEPAVIADLTEAPKKRGRPRKVADLTAGDKKAELVVEETGQVKIEEEAADPQPATQTADTATTTQVGSTTTETSAPVAVEPETSAATESLSKPDIVKILTGLQVHLEKNAKDIEEKKAAAQRCRDLIKSVVGSESLKDAKPEHFGKIKSAVLKVLNNE